MGPYLMWTVSIAAFVFVSGVQGQGEWVTLGRGCCADNSGTAVTDASFELTGITSAAQCRRESEARPGTDAVEYDKDNDICKVFNTGIIFQSFEDFYGCLATKRCLKFFTAAPSTVPTPAPSAAPNENSGSGSGVGRGGDDDPTVDEEDSNYSVQQGDFNYLTSYYANNRPSFGIVAGRASLLRTATGVSKISIAFKVGLSLEVDGITAGELASLQFPVRLHADSCDNDGGLIYQDPYICGEQPGGRCSESLVDLAEASGAPIQVTWNVSVNTNAHFESISEFEWQVHVPNSYLGQSRETLSVVIYDPVNGARMTCADLEDDRITEGILYYINTQDVSFVPVVTESMLTRTERGSTQLSMQMLNLPNDRTFRVYLHSLACVPLPGVAASAQVRGGDIYMRDISCYGRVGDIGCEVEEDNALFVEFVGSGLATTMIDVSFPILARADAASLVLYICDAGGCEVDETVLTCVDLLNDIPEIVTTSSAGPLTARPITDQPTPSPSVSPTPSPTPFPSSAPTPLPSTAPTPFPSSGPNRDPTVAPTTSAPTTRSPATSNPTTSAPTVAVTKVANTLPPSAESIDIQNDDIDGSGDGGIDRIDVAVFDDEGECPDLKLEYTKEAKKAAKKQDKGTKGKKGKKSNSRLSGVALPGEAGSACCLPASPPDGLISFSFLSASPELSGNRAAGVAIIVGSAGSVFLLAGIVAAIYRSRSSSGYELVDDDKSEYSYVEPVERSSAEKYTNAWTTEEIDEECADEFDESSYAVPMP